jgi:hypothetical protein
MTIQQPGSCLKCTYWTIPLFRRGSSGPVHGMHHKIRLGYGVYLTTVGQGAAARQRCIC